jgi:hypothetical protein
MTIRRVKLLASCAISWVAIVTAPTPCTARSVVFPTIEWLTVSSPHIAVMRVEAVRDSTVPAANGAPLRSVYLRAQEVLRGTPPTYLRAPRTLVNYEISPLVGDRVMVFFNRPDAGWEEHQESWFLFELTSAGFYEFDPAISMDASILHGEEILRTVRKRLHRMRTGRPLGDSRRVEPAGVWSGKGSLTLEIPEGSEASDSIVTLSRNYVCVPADIELLPRFMAEAADTSAWVRATAACRLVRYPAQARSTLWRLLGDRGTSFVNDPKVLVHPVSFAAFEALRVLGVAAPKPPFHDEETRLLGVWFSCDRGVTP